MNKKILIVFICCLLTADISSAQQQSSSDERAAESDAAREMRSDETEASIELGGSTDGVVLRVGPRSIVVQDVDEDGSTYTITVKSNTTYEGVDSLFDIHSGDTVGVDYYGGSDNLIAEEIIMKNRASPPEGEDLPKLEKVLKD